MIWPHRLTYSELQPGSLFKYMPTPVTGSLLMLFPLPDNLFRLTPPLSGQFLLALQISAQKLLPKKLSWSDSYVPCGSAWLHMFMEPYLFLQCSPFSLHLSPPPPPHCCDCCNCSSTSLWAQWEQGLCLVCAPLYPDYQGQCIVKSRHLVNSCWTNDEMDACEKVYYMPNRRIWEPQV